MATNTAIQVKTKKIMRYIPRLKMLSVVMTADVLNHVITYRIKKKLTKRQQNKWI